MREANRVALAWAALTLVTATMSTAMADRPAPAQPSAEEVARFRDGLKRGRKLASSGDLDGALAAFKDALAAMPEEPRVLDEMGVVGWRKKDLPFAERTLRRAVELQADAHRRAAALYNLGRVLEDKSDKPGAIDAYTRSLRDRPNKIVRERLGTLDATAAAALDPLTPRTMEGPVASVKAWCREQKKDCKREPDDLDEAGKPKPPLAWSCETKKVPAAPPFAEVALVSTSCRDDDREREDVADVLAVRLTDGWYFAGLGDAHVSMRQSDEISSSAKVAALVAGGPVRVVVRSTKSTMYRGMNAAASVHVVLAGVGPSGKPSASAPFLVETTEDEDDEETGDTKAHREGQLPITYLPEDVVELGAPIKKRGHPFDADTLGALVGKHHLTFP